MRGKILFVATITKHILRFHLPYLKWFQDAGYETHVAANGSESIPFCDKQHNLPIQRSPFSILNIAACYKLKKIIEENDYILIHGHTPMGGVLCRLAAKGVRSRGTTLLYTAHGFHFYKGAPILNWMFYYPVEKHLARITDGIITINTEDYELLYTHGFKCKGKFLIPGVGVDNSRFHPVSDSYKAQLRNILGYHESQLILIYMAELIPRKNHRFIINAVPEILKTLPEIKVIFAGRGKLLEKMKKYSQQLGVASRIDFLGFRDDIDKLLAISDIGISSSRQEGLGINIAEAMYMGLPIVATDTRGHREMVKHGENGFLFELNNTKQFMKFISAIASDKKLRDSFGKRSTELVEKFSLSNSIEAMARIYKSYDC